MAKDGRRHQDMSIEEILKSIRGIIDNRTDIPQTNEDDILELTDAVDDRTDINNNEKSATGINNKITNGPGASMLSEEAALKTSVILKHFSNTTKNMHVSNSHNKTNTLEDIVIQMLRPEISKWLEENLPLLVKQLVEIEIQKLKPHD